MSSSASLPGARGAARSTGTEHQSSRCSPMWGAATMGAPTSRRFRLLGRWLIMAVGFFFAMNLWSSETGVSGLPMADGLAGQPPVAYEVANGQSAGCGVCDMQRDAASDPGVT